MRTLMYERAETKQRNSPEAVVWQANAIWLNHRWPQGQFEIMSSERCFRKKSIAEGSEGLLPGLVVTNDGITVGPSSFFFLALTLQVY